MIELIQPFDFDRVFLEPWLELGSYNIWIVVMGFLVCLACGLVGLFLVLRRLSLTGDAMSHSLLPGIVLAFLVSHTRDTLPMFVGALLAGLVTVVLIEAVHTRSRVKTDASMGIVFSMLFALGVLMISLFADQVDLDADCVLYGEIAFIGLAPPVALAGAELAPAPIVRMAGVLLALVVGLVLFYKELVLTSFDPGLARSLGVNPTRYHYGLMAALALVAVSAFEAVGSILVVAMLIFPAATVQLLSTRLPVQLMLILPLAVIYSLGGFHLAVWLDASIAACMTVMAGMVFLCIWVGSVVSRRPWRVAKPGAPVLNKELGNAGAQV